MYTSIDLTEVELIENENGPRENHSVLLDVSRHLFIEKISNENLKNI